MLRLNTTDLFASLFWMCVSGRECFCVLPSLSRPVLFWKKNNPVVMTFVGRGGLFASSEFGRYDLQWTQMLTLTFFCVMVVKSLEQDVSACKTKQRLKSHCQQSFTGWSLLVVPAALANYLDELSVQESISNRALCVNKQCSVQRLNCHEQILHTWCELTIPLLKGPSLYWTLSE